MEFETPQDYYNFAKEVRHTNRYIHNGCVERFLSSVLASSNHRTNTIQQNTILWRAQLGNDWDARKQDGYSFETPIPYSLQRMIPPFNMPSEGRANPKGIAYLYLASNSKVAMTEVRPWVGSFISVARMQLLQEVKVVDCSMGLDKPKIFLTDPSHEETEKAVWSSINIAFSTPIDPSNKMADYVPTQILAEFFKKNGYDGIVYKSGLRDGYNIVLFNIQSVKTIDCLLYRARSVDFEFEI
jgi:RES domain-containing protein